ncbi:MAG: hypothetical protein OXP66_17430 [Candidatus Tectomicrobia bacterium]|nr:hypothetical protein [Candidatus Tectomicrobia bacterium]
MSRTYDRLSAICPAVALSMIVVGVFVVVVWGRSPSPVEVVSAFDLQEAAYIHDTGANVVEGRVFVRLWTGEEVLCRDKTVLLVPRTAFSEERIEYLYGGTREPGLRRHLQSSRKLAAPDPRYREYMRRAPCNQAGEFRFENVADGTYFAIGGAAWKETVGWVSISMMQPVDVEGGELVKMVLTPGSDT